MAAEAQLLGSGTKIMTAPAMSLNTEEYKALLNVPEGQTIAAVLLVGRRLPQKRFPMQQQVQPQEIRMRMS